MYCCRHDRNGHRNIQASRLRGNRRKRSLQEYRHHLLRKHSMYWDAQGKEYGGWAQGLAILHEMLPHHPDMSKGKPRSPPIPAKNGPF